MGTGYGNTMAVAHQLGEHFSTTHHWNTALSGAGNLWVFDSDRRGLNNHICSVDISFTVANKYYDTCIGKTFNTGIGAYIRTRNFIALI